MMPPTLRAADGLAVTRQRGTWRIAWGEPDWLGPLGLRLHDGVRWHAGGARDEAFDAVPIDLDASTRDFDGTDELGAYRGWAIDTECDPPFRASVRAYDSKSVVVFRLEATRDIRGLATRPFARPSAAWPMLFPSRRSAGGVPAGTTTYAHQWAEFALPVFGDAACSGFLLAPHRPPAIGPLLFIAPDGRTLLLGSLDHFHEQIIALPGNGEAGIACGWHGDLDRVPAGFATELAVWAAGGPRAALDAWAAELLRRNGTKRPSRDADPSVAKLSYWTDNGAHYYYRTEPGCDYLTTLERAVAQNRESGVPIGAVQLDSWFYPHEIPRAVGDAGAEIVPPSGLVRWEPREDLFPQGFARLRERLGDLPLIFHGRHFSARSPYFERHAAWVDGDYAHPRDATLNHEMLARAAAWGAVTYEQDWMVESFLGVRGLREEPGRARAWQEALDRSAALHGLSLQWCMASPADFLQTVTLERVTSIRTSGDYRYLFGNPFNWVWFLHGNALARALGLNPFKDVFLSGSDEPHAEVEALLSALSTGPVGIGDRLGATNRDVVLRTCREDGVLVKPDCPIAAIDTCFRASAFWSAQALTGETYSEHPAGRWAYIVTLNAAQAKQPLRAAVRLDDLGDACPLGPCIAYDWRRSVWSRIEPGGAFEIDLAAHDWDYRVLCPLLPGERAVFGDVSKYATVGDRRIAGITADRDTIALEVLGPPDTWAVVRGCSLTPPARATAGDIAWHAETNEWKLRLRIGESERVEVTLEW